VAKKTSTYREIAEDDDDGNDCNDFAAAAAAVNNNINTDTNNDIIYKTDWLYDILGGIESPGDGHLGSFLGRLSFVVKVDINRNRISADENTQ